MAVVKSLRSRLQQATRSRLPAEMRHRAHVSVRVFRGCTLLETRAYVLGPDGQEMEIELPDITAFLPQHLKDRVTETRCDTPSLPA